MDQFLKKIIAINIFISLNSIFSIERTPFMPNLPVGPFKTKFKFVSICNDTIDYPLKFNYYITKPTPTQILLKGNITFNIPLDDRLYFNFNMAIWSKIGGWKDNAFIYKNKGACLTMKFFMKNMWNEYLSKHHFTDCPIKPGFYKVDSYDLSQVAEANFPNQFFYGSYKTSLYFTDEQNVQVGCILFISDVLRPWE
ncbi:uncharacterized protein LOC126904563 [Daktulosphaira vitifoliae]|uniref:uncharacterized protein LOC126904563 n=1 Tax=Daktulosphaira vitifoliae TaxID=58002 RepID=UPI0021AAF70D|nr:uncharacterized protein LOC126904563 [Daktulosphaira vitifoliae]